MAHVVNRQHFMEEISNLFSKSQITPSQKQGIEAILNEWEKNYSKSDDRFLAYMFATAFHETAQRMQPIEEFGKGKGRSYGSKLKMTKDKAGAHIPYSTPDKLYYGRGFVQLTWYENYEKFGKLLKIDLLNQPELALQLDVSTQIMFVGMLKGLFTGVGLEKYFSGTLTDWKNARRIINGTDRADLIAGYATRFYAAISYMDI